MGWSIQLYFSSCKRLMKQDNYDYKRKQIVQEVESGSGTGEVIDCVEEFYLKEEMEKIIT